MQTTPLHQGEHGGYRWLSVLPDVHIAHLRDAFPEAFTGRFLAITSVDSGELKVNAELEAKGWRSSGGIATAYINTIEDLPQFPPNYEGFYDEWYLFLEPRDLGARFDGNPFERELRPGQLVTWVNYLGFALHEESVLTELFWRQMAWIQPETYLSDGRDSLNFATRDAALFERVRSYFANLSYT